jgi:hypothetical protein
MKRKMRHDNWMQSELFISIKAGQADMYQLMLSTESELDQTYNKLDNRKKKKKGKNALTVDFDDFGSVLSQIQTTDKPSEPFVRGTPTPSKKPFPDTNTKVTRKKARKANA